MRLYHFTCRLWWHFIRDTGIDRGEAPVSSGEMLNYPNLTSNPDPGPQQWAKAGRTARMLLDKTAVRITVDIPDGDRRLVSWRDYTTAHGMSKRDYRMYDARG